MSRTIQVAIWTHRHGDDVMVFQTIEGAKSWRQEIAAEWWVNEMNGAPMPDDPEKAADAYFKAMGERASKGEFFEVRAAELEG